MRGWRAKFIFLLIIYFVGFASAIYCLAPTPDNQLADADQQTFTYSVLKSDDFAKSFNTGMHKCINFGKVAAWQAAEFFKQKMRETQTDS